MSHPYRIPVPDANDLSLGRESMSKIASVLAGSDNLTTGIQDVQYLANIDIPDIEVLLFNLFNFIFFFTVLFEECEV